MGLHTTLVLRAFLFIAPIRPPTKGWLIVEVVLTHMWSHQRSRQIDHIAEIYNHFAQTQNSVFSLLSTRCLHLFEHFSVDILYAEKFYLFKKTIYLGSELYFRTCWIFTCTKPDVIKIKLDNPWNLPVSMVLKALPRYLQFQETLPSFYLISSHMIYYWDPGTLSLWHIFYLAPV